jgi:hypothetical protein
MDLDERVSRAFHAWEASRMELGRAKARLHAALGVGSEADTSEPLDQELKIQLLQRDCDEKFAQLLAVAELVSAQREFGAKAL